jgi:tellurite resistance protein TehA-like permease
MSAVFCSSLFAIAWVMETTLRHFKEDIREDVVFMLIMLFITVVPLAAFLVAFGL